MTAHLTVNFKGNPYDTPGQLRQVADCLEAGQDAGGREGFLWRMTGAFTLDGAARIAVDALVRGGWESVRFNVETGHISRVWSKDYDIDIDDLDEQSISAVAALCVAGRYSGEDRGLCDVLVDALEAIGCRAIGSPNKGVNGTVGCILPVQAG